MASNENTDVFRGAQVYLPLSRVTLAAKTKSVFEWMNRPAFSTGLLVANIEEKCILKQGYTFPTPSNLDIFNSDEDFEGHYFNEILVLECDPLAKGVLSLQTEIVVVDATESTIKETLKGRDETNGKKEMSDEFDKIALNRERSYSEPLEKCLATARRNIFISDFINPLVSRNSQDACGRLLEVVTAIDKKSKRDIFANFKTVLDYNAFQKHFQVKQAANFDIFNCALVSKDNAKLLSLFDGDFIVFCDTSKYANLAKYNKDRVICQVKVTDVCHFDEIDTHTHLFCLPTLSGNLKHVNTSSFRACIEKYASADPTVTNYSSSLSWNHLPPFANELCISCVHSPTYNCQQAYSKLLQKYFTVPRIVRKHGVIAVPSSDDEEFWQTENELSHVRKPMIFFKVHQLSPSHKHERTYLVDCAHTTVILEPPCHSYVPTVMNSVMDGQDPIIPPGLQKYHDTLVDWLKPFVSKRATHTFAGGNTAILLSGESGCGKSGLIHAVAASLNMHCFEVNSHELCGETSAACETRIKHVLHRAASFAPCVLSLRNIDALGKDRDGTSDDPRVAESFRNLIQSSTLDSQKYPVLIIASTSNLNAVSSDIQQAFIYSLHVDVPNESTREDILIALLKSVPLHHTVKTKHIAQRTAGMNLGDLKCLLANVKRHTHGRIVKYWHASFGGSTLSKEDERTIVESGVLLKGQDFDMALKDMQKAHTSSIGAPQIPNVSWKDVGGLKSVKRDILDTIQLPLEHPHLFTSGLRRSGVLFYGPPGTGKTLLAKAVATECSLNFLSVKGPELINMYVGQSEENVRNVFEKARSASPCVIFFDELDSLAPNRGRSGDSGGVMDRVVSQLLAELDGMSKSNDVFVIGATNRPDLLDPALLRPGRFDKMLYLGVSEDHESQLHILRALTRKFKLAADCDLDEIVNGCPFNMTGADFYALCSDAMLNALKTKVDLLQKGEEVDQSNIVVCRADFMQALDSLVPSISMQELERYRFLQQQLQQA